MSARMPIEAMWTSDSTIRRPSFSDFPGTTRHRPTVPAVWGARARLDREVVNQRRFPPLRERQMECGAVTVDRDNLIAVDGSDLACDFLTSSSHLASDRLSGLGVR